MPKQLSNVNQARIFVGSDRSQLLAVKVLEHSIRRHTDLPILMRSMHDLDLPQPNDLRQSARTGFSFTRFAIPDLAGHSGRAVYLDADMLVFRDFRELFELPFEGAKVIIQEELPETAQKPKTGAPPKRIKQCSVMLLDCAALDWRADEIIAGLGGRYTYEELLYHLCILSEEEIRYGVPFAWNSLEQYVPSVTGLIHYTDMFTQPWVNPDNANGYLWLNEVRMMLAEGELGWEAVKGEIDLGYFRPSLLEELAWPMQEGPPSAAEISRLKKIDADARYEAHWEVREQSRRRAQAIAVYERWLANAASTARQPEPGFLAAAKRRLRGWGRKAS